MFIPRSDVTGHHASMPVTRPIAPTTNAAIVIAPEGKIPTPAIPMA